MELRAQAGRLTIYCDAAQVWHHRPLHAEIMFRAHRSGLAGASTFSGLSGFSSPHAPHAPGTFALTQHVPAQVVIVDDVVVLEAFLTQLGELKGIQLATLELAEVVTCTFNDRDRLSRGPGVGE